MAITNQPSSTDDLLFKVSQNAYNLALDLGSLLMRLRHYSCDDLAAMPAAVAAGMGPEFDGLAARLQAHSRTTRKLIIELEAVGDEGRARAGIGRSAWPTIAEREVFPANMWAELLGEFEMQRPLSGD